MSEKNEWKKIENLYNDAKGSFIIRMELNVKKRTHNTAIQEEIVPH